MRFSTALLFSCLLACGTSDPPGDPDAGSPLDAGSTTPMARVELGTGQSNFELIGPHMELVAGPQGGWHLFASCRLYEMNVEMLRLSYRTERDGATISMPVEYVLTERRLVREGDHWVRAGDLVIFEISMPADVVGDTVTVTVTADPTDAEPVSDSKTAMVVDEVP